MSAIPQKKLCWNCDGNIAKDINNCPYCGVYLHGDSDAEEQSFWSPTYQPKDKKDSEEEIPLPVYSLGKTEEQDESEKEESPSLASSEIIAKLKKDFLPTIFLMSGSVFFLFGIILFLFSREGSFTLQWNGDNWKYFLGFSLPFLFFGWKFLNQIDNDD